MNPQDKVQIFNAAPKTLNYLTQVSTSRCTFGLSSHALCLFSGLARSAFYWCLSSVGHDSPLPTMSIHLDGFILWFSTEAFLSPWRSVSELGTHNTFTFPSLSLIHYYKAFFLYFLEDTDFPLCCTHYIFLEHVLGGGNGQWCAGKCWRADYMEKKSNKTK